MSIREMIKSDLDTTLQGDFQFPWQYKDSNGQFISVDKKGNELVGQVLAIGQIRDPQTNLHTEVKRVSISFKSDILETQIKQGMVVKTTTIDGNPIQGTVKNLVHDDAIGFTVFQIEKSTNANLIVNKNKGVV